MYRAIGPGFHLGGHTSPPDTPITCLCPPYLRGHTRLTSLAYDTGGAQHTLTILKTLGTTTLSASAAANATSLTLTADPGTGTVAGAMAAVDYLCVQLDDDTFAVARIVAVSSLVVTISPMLPAAATSGNYVWFFGQPLDHAGNQTRSSPTIGVRLLADSAPPMLIDHASGICASTNPYQPLLIHSDNIQTRGTIRAAAGCHTAN
jgi:hypothetical protein